MRRCSKRLAGDRKSVYPCSTALARSPTTAVAFTSPSSGSRGRSMAYHDDVDCFTDDRQCCSTAASLPLLELSICHCDSVFGDDSGC